MPNSTNNRFKRSVFGNKPTYKCSSCGKLTRDTGEGEASCGTCAFCYLECGEENSLSDGNCTKEQFIQAVLRLEVRYKRLSPNPIMQAYHRQHNEITPDGPAETDQERFVRETCGE